MRAPPGPLQRAAQDRPGLRIFSYNFPCSFAIEAVDDACRVMLYGHGTRGTEGPIFVFTPGTPYHAYFTDQLAWLTSLAEQPREPWLSKGVSVRPLADLNHPDDPAGRPT